MRVLKLAALGTVAILLGACQEDAKLSKEASYGANPALPKPEQSLIPQNNTAGSGKWQNGETPAPASGLAVNAFATDLDHPRWLYVLPNGDVLVAESNKGTSCPHGIDHHAAQ